MKGFRLVFATILFPVLAWPGIQVTMPRGGETFNCGQTITVAWTSSGCGDRVKIFLAAGGQSVALTDRIPSVEGANSASVVLPASQPTGNYRIRVLSVSGTYCVGTTPLFAVQCVAAPQGRIVVLSPNGGETWWAGTAYEIRWSSENVQGNVKISLKKGDLGVQTATAPNAGTALWQCQSLQDGTDFRVRIENADGTIFDESDRPFTIRVRSIGVRPDLKITVTAPNGGETYAAGSLQAAIPVRWTSSGITGDVRLILKKGPESVKTAVVANSESSEMSLSGAVAGNDYKIRVESLNGAVFDESDRTFTVAPGMVAGSAEVRMPPMILSFAIDGGAESTTGPTATLSHTARNGPTLFRWKDGLEENWQNWEPWSSAPTVRLPALFGLRKIFLQLKNDYGESRVADDLITVIDTREQEYEVDAGMIAGPCPGDWPAINPGWKEIAIVDRTPPSAGAIEVCELTSPGKYGIYSLVVHIPIPGGPLAQVGGEKCEFVLFSGRLLNEGWSFVRLIYDPPSPDNYRIAQQPSPGGRDITFRIRMWSGGGYSPSCKMKKIVIRGPSGRDPVEAFR